MKRHLIALATLTAGVTLASCAGQSMLLHPTPNEARHACSPDSFRVVMETTRGLFTLMIHRDWSPYGSDRFYSLVANGYYNEARFFRVVPGFVAQFGISGNPLVNVAWQNQHIPDDHMMRSNIRGTIAFGNDGPDSRAVQVFINLADNTRLDTAGARGFPPIGAVVDGMFVVDSLYGGYGEGRRAARALHRTPSPCSARHTSCAPFLDWTSSAPRASPPCGAKPEPSRRFAAVIPLAADGVGAAVDNAVAQGADFHRMRVVRTGGASLRSSCT